MGIWLSQSIQKIQDINILSERKPLSPLPNETFLIADDYVKKEFGTGCVKITPAYDPNDFAMGKRHGLTFLNIMNENGTLNESVPESFRGLDRFEARKRIIKKLKELDLFEQQEKNRHSVPTSDRSKTIIEPRLSKQWYVNMQTFAEPAIQYAKSGELNFYQTNGKKPTIIGSKTSKIGVSRDSFGGDQVLFGTAMTAREFPVRSRIRLRALITEVIKLNKIKTFSILGFELVIPLSPFGWPEETKT